MNRTKSLLLVVAVLAWLTVAPRPASAEPFADIHFGAAITQGADVTASSLGVAETALDVDFDNSFSIGGRAGYWFEAPPLHGVPLNFGLALDISHFSPDIGTQIVTVVDPGGPDVGVVSAVDLSVTAISFDLMLRWPLMVSREFPKGQLQPYFSIGPAIFITSAEDTLIFDPPGQSETDASVGVKLGLGAAWLFLKNVAVFGEYRFTHFSPEFEFRDDVGGVPVPATLETDVNTHYFLVGASYRF
jgi:opacity protein-like surface antigen